MLGTAHFAADSKGTGRASCAAATAKNYAGLPGWLSLILTYVAFTVILGIGVKSLGGNVGKFVYGFTIIFFLTFVCVAIGNQAHIAANSPKDIERFGLAWSLKLTGEAGLIIALLGGLFIGNYFPGFAESLKEATRPEWYIKTAIVILGALVGVKAAGALGLASAVMFRGLCAIIEAYLIYWAVVYWLARKYFRFSSEWAAPLASGISICRHAIASTERRIRELENLFSPTPPSTATAGATSHRLQELRKTLERWQVRLAEYVLIMDL